MLVNESNIWTDWSNEQAGARSIQMGSIKSYLPGTTRQQGQCLNVFDLVGPTWRPATLWSVSNFCRLISSLVLALFLLTGVMYNAGTPISISTRLESNCTPSTFCMQRMGYSARLHRIRRLQTRLLTSTPACLPSQPDYQQSDNNYIEQSPPRARLLNELKASRGGPVQRKDDESRWGTFLYKQEMHEVPNGPDPIHNRFLLWSASDRQYSMW